MKRFNNFYKRPDFAQQLEAIGMNYWNLPSGPEQLPYWQEGVCYTFTEAEIDRQQAVTQELHDMHIDCAERMITSGDYPAYFRLTDLEKSLIEQSWKNNEQSLYGRFDLAYDEQNRLKMFEYNGDTPVSILECSIGQWNYLEQNPELPEELKIQYNLIDETLIETWQKRFNTTDLIHFAASGGFRHEDFGNLVYIMDTALRAGIRVKELQMEDIGTCTEFCNGNARQIFTDLQDEEILNIFKLYPWEWMTGENFGKGIVGTSTKWMEPAWKMLMSNKAMSIKLWADHTAHPNLLPSYDFAPNNGKWAKKAIHGREGSNINVYEAECGKVFRDELAQGSHAVPEYDHWGYMYQEWFNIKPHDGYYPIIGSWVIGDKACGMSIREDKNLVTGMDAFFASHLFVPEGLEQKYQHLL